MQTLTYEVFKELLKATEENPMDRFAMAERMNVHEKKIRNAITDLRNMKIPVCASSTNVSKRGYWIANTMTEFNRFSSEYTHRSKEIQNTASAMSDGIMCWLMNRNECIRGTENVLLR